jgi:hypothetical protein
MRHREHFPSISPALLPPYGFSAEQWIKEGKQAVKMTRLSCQASG